MQRLPAVLTVNLGLNAGAIALRSLNQRLACVPKVSCNSEFDPSVTPKSANPRLFELVKANTDLGRSSYLAKCI